MLEQAPFLICEVMMQRRRAIFLICLVAALSLSGCADSSELNPVQDEVRRALDEQVRERQEEYFATHGFFASDASDLDLADLLPSGVLVRVSSADESGYSVVATHASIPTTPCTLFVGNPPTYSAIPTPHGTTAAQVGQEGTVQCAPVSKQHGAS